MMHWSGFTLFAQACLSEYFKALFFYRKTPKNSDTWKTYFNNPKISLIWTVHREIHLNNATGMANSVDPDQTAPRSSDLSLHCLSKNLGTFSNMLFLFCFISDFFLYLLQTV